MSMTIQELFEKLADQLDAEAAGDLNRTLQWRITDADPGVWALRIADGSGELIPGGVSDPDTIFETTGSTWVAIAEGRQDAMRAFMTGKLKVSGDMMLALKVPRLFPTAA